MFGGHSLQHTEDKVFTHEFPSLLTLPECLRQMHPTLLWRILYFYQPCSIETTGCLDFVFSLQKGCQYQLVHIRFTMRRGNTIFSIPRSKAAIPLILSHLRKLLLSISIMLYLPCNVTHQSLPRVPPNCYLVTLSYRRSVLPIRLSATLTLPFRTWNPSSHSPVQTPSWNLLLQL